jgi:hypothetical protein
VCEARADAPDADNDDVDVDVDAEEEVIYSSHQPGTRRYSREGD